MDKESQAWLDRRAERLNEQIKFAAGIWSTLKGVKKESARWTIKRRVRSYLDDGGKMIKINPRNYFKILK